METLEEPLTEKPPMIRHEPPKPPECPSRYTVPRESPFWIFLPVSVLTLFTAAYVTARFAPVEEEVKQITVELNDIEGVENEPPPLGEPDAPKEELPPQPEPTPPPAEPDPTPPPPPVEKPEFELPDPAPTPPPKPKPAQEKPRPKPVEKPAMKPATALAPTLQRGSPTGKVGGRGGSKGDFISTPHPQYDSISLRRRFQGKGEVFIVYENGRIIDVTMSQSTGVDYLDSRTTTWVRSRYKVKAGASGKAKFNITWQLPN